MNVNDYMKKCKLCPRNCQVDRTKQSGFCGASSKVIVAKEQLHFYEEPCISGKEGSGTIFFAGCNMRCKYCQNYKISTFCFDKNKEYKEYSIMELANIMLKLQSKGANNINLVTGFMYVPQIINAIDLAKSYGLNIPIVYNTSGYESIDTIKILKGYVDVYLPDFKYYYKELAKNLSNVDNYFEVATKAISEMKNQVGENVFNENGIMQKGLIIRHLILPNHLQNTKQVLKYIFNNFGKDTYVSIMAQYFPEYKAKDLEEINRKITLEEYTEIVQFVEKLGFTNGFIQDFSNEDETKYVPDF